MKNIIFLTAFIVIIIISYFMSTHNNGSVREPAVAGAFYPADKGELTQMIDGYLNDADSPAVPGKIKALIVPHAGYVYSGHVAAYGYKKLIGQEVETVILVGNSHYEYFDGISIYPKGHFQTPLGLIPIDVALASKLLKANPKIYFRESAHLEEHSLEVQLPFLQRVLKNFKIIPIILGDKSDELIEILSEALKNNINDKTLLIASSDLSHYPTYFDANYADHKVIEAILTGDVNQFKNTLEQLEEEGIPNAATFACGEGAIKVIMLVAQKTDATSVTLLKYSNSGDVSDEQTRVVGYSAIAFSQQEKGEEKLTEEEQTELLKIARQAVESYVRNGQIDPRTRYPNLQKHLGAFVTLKKHNRLRGCIGRFNPDIPLYQVVVEMAIAAATQDSRFQPVNASELPELEYEISVLSPLKKIDSWQDIQISKHGVQIVKGFHSGVFLPQVATENNLDLESFLSLLCQEKAGLPADCYKNPDVELYVFTAQVFGEG